MRPLRTITATEMRGINRSAILDLIRREGPTSRSKIAERLQVSLPTVMRIVDSLIEEGLVIPTGFKEWSGGRRRPLVGFNASGFMMIGVDLGGTKIYGAVANLGGEILYEENVPHHQTSGDESYRCLAELIQSLLDFASSTSCKIRGIGVGAPGVIDAEKGVVLLAPGLDWRDFPLKEKLLADFLLPVIVDNDVNLAALGELWFGVGQDANNLVVIAIGTGIGAGVILDGALYRGSHQIAGEIGYLLPDRSSLGKAFAGFGALEQLASGTGVAERARSLIRGSYPDEWVEQLTAEDVFEAARNQEGWACQIVAETVDYLAQAVSTVSLCFDPDVIVLGGGVARSADLLIGPVMTRLEGVMPIQPNLVASTLGYKATVMGAIINLLHNTSDFYMVRKLS